MKRFFVVLAALLSLIFIIIMAKNTSLGVKESVEKMSRAYEIDTDSLFEHLDKMEKSAATSKDPVERSIYYSLLASYYQKYYRNNRFSIDDRTDIDGPAPKDMREWTKKNFLDTISVCVDKSIKEKQALLNANIKDYKEVLLKRDSALRPTMYDILVHRAIDIYEYDTAKVNAYYKDLIESHKDDPIARDAAKLEWIDYRSSKDDNYPYNSGFADEYKDSPLYVYAKALELKHDSITAKQKHDACLEIEKKFPKNPYLCSIIRLREELEEKSIRMSNLSSNTGSKLIYPGIDEKLEINYRSVKHITVEIYKLNMNASEFDRMREPKESDYSLVSKKEYDIDTENDFEYKSLSVDIGQDSCGIYEVRVTPDGDKAYTIDDVFYVTRFMMLQKGRDGGMDVYVVDRMSGKPQKGVTIYNSDKTLFNSFGKTDEKGILSIKCSAGRYSLAIEKEDDNCYPVKSVFIGKNDSEENTHNITSFFLDRAIYRPGQKVMAKGVNYNMLDGNCDLVAGKKIEVSLCDANGSRVETKQVVTNEYGSFYVEFDIPEGLLNGLFSLRTNGGSCQFRVEEYKRPTFEVKVDNVAATSISEIVKVKGNAKYYRGVGVGGATISYKVVSNPVYYCIWGWTLPQIKNVVASGSAECDADGNFAFEFTPDIVPENNHPFYRLNIEVDVTDVSNETQVGTYSFVIGETSYSLNVPIGGMVDKDALGDVVPEAYDCTGNKVTLKGKYQLWGADWKVIKEGEFTSGKALDIDFKGCESSKYKLTLSTVDDKQRSVVSYSEFTLYSIKDSKPAVESLLWVVPVKTKCSDGENAEVLVGSSFDTYTLCELYSGDCLVERKILNLKSKNEILRIKFKESYKDNLTLNLVTVRNCDVKVESVKINRILKSRDLKVEYTHIKKLYEPLEKDVWRAVIKDVDGNAITAEALVGMYDASLDAFSANRWSFNPVHKIYRYPMSWEKPLLSSIVSGRNYNYAKTPDYRFEYPSLNTYGFTIWNYSSVRYSMGGGSMRAPASGGMKRYSAMSVSSDEVVLEDAVQEGEYEEAELSEPEVEESDESITLRSNFAETALFYPQILAKNGEFEVEFTAPEALTNWKVMTLVYSKDIRTAVSVDTVVTQKSLSVNTNLPRFVRTTDLSEFAATIDNLSSSDMEVAAKWIVTDVISGAVVAEKTQTLNIKSKSQGATQCKVNVPRSASLLMVRVTVKGGDYTDGVEAMVPVLSSQTLVTELMPICIYKDGDFDYKFESLANNRSESLINRAFTINITPDAATMALQSLPFVKNPIYENAVDFALSYYVNWISSEAVKSNKNIRAYLERLKSGSQKVVSPLADNESLKNILLQESPWVMEAKFETERNNSLVELLDAAAQERARNNMLRKLFKLQNADGGFSWFEGGLSSAYITQFVVAQLQKSGFDSKDLGRAISYLISEMERTYQESLESSGPYTPSSFTIESMLLIGKQSGEAYTYYYDYVKKNWKSYSLPVQALIARLLHAGGDADIAREIVANLRKFYVYKPTMGLYWPNTSNIYTQSDYIETFATVDPDNEELAKMKLWLLFNKQTNMWTNSIATADAIGALVFTGNSVGDDDTRVVVKVGGVTLDSDSVQWAAEMKYTFDGKDVTPELADVNIHKQGGNSLTLGAAYWQYTEDVDKVEKHSDDRLKIEKSYYVEKNGVLKPVNLTSDIRTADKVVVRMAVTADRSMDFIHLRDLRPAGLEPVKQVSGYMVQSGLYYYMCTKDYSVDLFFDYMPKGTYIFEYELKATLTGDYAAGFATIESMYSADFKSQTKGERLVVTAK